MAANETCDERIARLGKQFDRRALLFNLAVIHHKDNVSQCHCFFLAVRHMHKSNAKLTLQQF